MSLTIDSPLSFFKILSRQFSYSFGLYFVEHLLTRPVHIPSQLRKTKLNEITQRLLVVKTGQANDAVVYLLLLHR